MKQQKLRTTFYVQRYDREDFLHLRCFASACSYEQNINCYIAFINFSKFLGISMKRTESHYIQIYTSIHQIHGLVFALRNWSL